MDQKIANLISQYGPDQRTDAWHAKRSEMLTASEIFKAIEGSSQALKHEIVMSKLVPRPQQEGNGPRALMWGTRFEPIAKEIYCEANDLKIVDTSCIPHPQYSFLGASPDGIIITKDVNDARYGKLVEFKCPISRVFSDDTPIPIAYYHQMQLQLECTELNECEYIEMAFKELGYSEWFDCKDKKSAYAFCNAEVRYKKFDQDLFEWLKTLEDRDKWTIVYWSFVKQRTTTVSKDPNWLSTNLDSFKQVWSEVEMHRANNTLPDHPNKKNTLVL